MTPYHSLPGTCCACLQNVPDVPAHFLVCRSLAQALPTRAEAREQARTSHARGGAASGDKMLMAADRMCAGCGQSPRLVGLAYCGPCRKAVRAKSDEAFKLRRRVKR